MSNENAEKKNEHKKRMCWRYEVVSECIVNLGILCLLSDFNFFYDFSPSKQNPLDCFFYVTVSTDKVTLYMSYMEHHKWSWPEKTTDILWRPYRSFPAKWRLRKDGRNSILMTCHYPDLDST